MLIPEKLNKDNVIEIAEKLLEGAHDFYMNSEKNAREFRLMVAKNLMNQTMQKQPNKLCYMRQLIEGDRFYLPGNRNKVFQVYETYHKVNKLRYGVNQYDATRVLANTPETEVVFLRNVNVTAQ